MENFSYTHASFVARFWFEIPLKWIFIAIIRACNGNCHNIRSSKTIAEGSKHSARSGVQAKLTRTEVIFIGRDDRTKTDITVDFSSCSTEEERGVTRHGVARDEISCVRTIYLSPLIDKRASARLMKDNGICYKAVFVGENASKTWVTSRCDFMQMRECAGCVVRFTRVLVSTVDPRIADILCITLSRTPNTITGSSQ